MEHSLTAYPDRPALRSEWIRALRPPRHALDPFRAWAHNLEPERSADGTVAQVLTVFLTNRECPFRCLMCDLWKNTLEHPVPPGAIPRQIATVLAEVRANDRASPSPRQLKLYNSGSFFDPGAIPLADYEAVARQLDGFERVIVECHPAFVGERATRFQSELAGTLEIAMGLETVHPAILPRLNKRMTLDQFARAAGFIRDHGMALRAFVLVKPPFMDEAGAVDWACRSVQFALDQGATAVSLIPTRAGNGALEHLARRGEFGPPRLATFERAFDTALALGRGRGRVFADTWDLEVFSNCATCFPARVERLTRMNLDQEIAAPFACPSCGEPS